MSRGARVCVGLSGGIDSVALLDVVLRDAAALEASVAAVHVHHGISRHADEWVMFCRDLCRRRRVPLRVERVDIGPWRDQHGVEAAARIARYRVFVQLDSDAVLLAQHLDDQAETVLLQLLRGAGAAGLAAMGSERTDWATLIPTGQTPPESVPKIVRPLLGVSRAEIAAYASHRRLRWIEDDTNADERFARNRLRRRVMPVLVDLQQAAVANLARSARHLASADRLLNELARADLATMRTQHGLSVRRILALEIERGQNALRGWLRTASAPPLETDQLDELWSQLASPSGSLALRFTWQGWSIERYRDEIRLQALTTAQPAAQFAGLRWAGEREWPLDSLGGLLSFRRTRGRGIAADALQGGVGEVRVRQGGERIRVDLRAGHRTLKNLFQERAVPARARLRWPLLFIDGTPACVPGVGYADAFRCTPGKAGWAISWQAADGQSWSVPGELLEKWKRRAKIKS